MVELHLNLTKDFTYLQLKYIINTLATPVFWNQNHIATKQRIFEVYGAFIGSSTAWKN